MSQIVFAEADKAALKYGARIGKARTAAAMALARLVLADPSNPEIPRLAQLVLEPVLLEQEQQQREAA